MKRFLVGLILVFFLVGSAWADYLNQYPLNTSPEITDQVTGIDDPSGSWAVNRFSFGDLWVLFQAQSYTPTGALDFSTASSVASGPLAWTASATLPGTPTDGQFAYYSGGTFDVMGFYNSDTWRYFLAFNSFPDTSGQALLYDGAGGFGWAIPGSVTADSVTTFTNKTYDADGTGNVLSNVDVANFAPSAVETSAEGLTDTDGAFPTSATVYNEIATLTALVNALQSTMDSQGLNTFFWTFSQPTSTPYYVSSTSAAFAYTITDTSSTYDPASVQFQVNSGGYGGSGTTTACTVTGLTENASNTVQLQVSDDKSPANTGESQEFTVISDTTDPVGAADADGTHSGSGDSITSGVDWTDPNLDTSSITCTVVNATPTNPTITTVGNACDTEALTPDGTGTVTCTWNADDLAGNSATPVVQEFMYSAPAASPDYQWDLDDNAATSVVSATYGTDAIFYVGGTQTNTSTVHEGTTYIEGSGSFKNPAGGRVQYNDLSAVTNDGIFSVQVTFYGDGNGAQSSYPRLVATSATNHITLLRNGSDTELILYMGGSNVGAFTVSDIDNTLWQQLRLVCDAGGDASGTGDDVALYQRTSTDGTTWSAWAMAGSFAAFTNPIATTIYFYGQGDGTSSWGSDTNDYYVDQVTVWDSAEMP